MGHWVIGVKSHGWLPSPVSGSHKHCSVDHFFLKLWVLASPFFWVHRQDTRCTVGVVACFKPTQARTIAGESNMEGSSGEKGVQEGPAFGLAWSTRGGLSAFGSKAQPVVRMGGDRRSGIPKARG